MCQPGPLAIPPCWVRTARTLRTGELGAQLPPCSEPQSNGISALAQSRLGLSLQSPSRNPERPRILLVTLRRLGDVLLTTPLVHALRERWPRAVIDMLVFQGTEGILAGNPDIDRVLMLPEQAAMPASLRMIGRIWRRYDLAIATQTGDRPSVLTFAAGRRRIGFIAPNATGSWWKRYLLHHRVPVGTDHRVAELMRLATCLGVTGPARVVCPAAVPITGGPSGPYAVLHASPMFAYRRWTDAGWRGLVDALAGRGLAVVVTGGPAEANALYLNRIFQPLAGAVRRLDGQLTWPELTEVLRRAAIYVGPDTSVTHLAAATGCPTIAIYGPVSPRLMGPWPRSGLAQPWGLVSRVQRRENVWIVQHPLPCVPCEKLGCEGHLASRSRCLDELPIHQVIAAIDEALTPDRMRASSRAAADLWRATT